MEMMGVMYVVVNEDVVIVIALRIVRLVEYFHKPSDKKDNFLL